MAKQKLYIDLAKTPIYTKRLIGTPQGAKLVNSDPYFALTDKSPAYCKVTYDKKEKAYLLDGTHDVYTKSKPIKTDKFNNSNAIINS